MIKKITLTFCSILVFSSLSVAREHPYFVDGIDASPNGRYVAISRLDNKLVLFDLEERKIIKAFAGKPEEVLNNNTFFTPDNKYWVIQDRSLILRFWDIEKQEFVKEVELESEANGLIFFKDGKRMIWGGADGRIEYVNLETDERKILKKPNPYPSFSQEIRDIVLSPDEKRFVSVTHISSYKDSFEEPEGDFGPAWEGSKDILVKHNGINLWDAQTLTKIKKLRAKDVSDKAWATFSPDGKYVFTSYENGQLHQWKAEDGELVRAYDWSEGQGKNVSCLDNFGRWIGTVEPSVNELTVIDPINKVHFTTRKFKYEAVFGQMTTIPSKNLIITGDTDGSISVYKFDPEKLDIELIWHPEPIKSGIITWVSPLKTMFKSEEEARKMQQDYIEQQKKMGYEDEEPVQKNGQNPS